MEADQRRRVREAGGFKRTKQPKKPCRCLGSELIAGGFEAGEAAVEGLGGHMELISLQHRPAFRFNLDGISEAASFPQ